MHVARFGSRGMADRPTARPPHRPTSRPRDAHAGGRGTARHSGNADGVGHLLASRRCSDARSPPRARQVEGDAARGRLLPIRLAGRIPRQQPAGDRQLGNGGGEPAAPHRPSAAADPLAPISHHWQDGTHITFGVLTAGVFTRTVKLEASWFSGREPDENRTDFDYTGRRLDSYSARLTVNPGRRWSLSSWYAYLKSPEALHPNESLHRIGAAVLTTQPVGAGGTWSSALIYGANDPIGTGRLASSVLVETALDLDGTNSFFGRAEYVQKSAEELVIPAVPQATQYGVGVLALGYLRGLGTMSGLSVGAGIRGSINFVPSILDALYGSRTPTGVAIYLRLRPAGTRDAGMMMP